MMRLRGRMVCMTEDEAEAVRIHRAEHIRLTLAEPGCLTFDIADTDDPKIFEVMEAFRDAASFAAHQERTRRSAWFAATRTILRDFRVEELGD